MKKIMLFIINNILRNELLLEWLTIFIGFCGLILSIKKYLNERKSKIDIKKISAFRNGKYYAGFILSNNRDETIIVDLIYIYDKFRKSKKSINLILRKNTFDSDNLNETIECKVPFKLLSQERLFMLIDSIGIDLLKNNLVYGKEYIYLTLTNGETVKVKITRKFINRCFKKMLKYNT